MTDYERFTNLRVDGPDDDGVVELVLDAPHLNAVSEAAHGELAEIWRAFDADPAVRAVLLRGEGKGFSAGGSFDLVEKITTDFDARTRTMREARDLVYNILDCSKPIVSAVHGPAVGAGLVAAVLADVSVVDADREDHRRAHPARRGRGRPRRDLLAAAVRHGEGQVLPADLPTRSPARRPSASGSCRCASTRTPSCCPPRARSPTSSRPAPRWPSGRPSRR